jgi:electron transfer flavoprotein beta subunit
LRILIFITGVYDVKVPLEYDEPTGRIKQDKNIMMLNPADRSAIECALEIKGQTPGNHIILIHLGLVQGERFLRQGLAMGCDEALRVWDDEMAVPRTRAKALILSRVSQILSFDLILTGSRSQDSGAGQLGSLIASALHIPCVTHATALRTKQQDRVIATKQLSDGSVQRVESPIPLVVTVDAAEESIEFASFPASLKAAEQTIPCLGLPDIGIPHSSIGHADSLLTFGPLRQPASRLKYIPAPDSALPAYERRMQLLEGSMRKRRGKIVNGDEDEMVEELFRTLLARGWLNDRHLKE